MTEEDRIKLKQLLLQALINRESLPGSKEPVIFPDLSLLLNEPAIYLLDKEMKEDGFLKSPGKPVQIVSSEFLAAEARKAGKVAYLQMMEEEQEEQLVTVRIELKVISSSDKRSFVLSSMQLRLQKFEGSWRVVGYPTTLSA